MMRIPDELQFMKGRAVTVCTKACIERKTGHKKPCFPAIFQKTASKTKDLDSPM
jgi:hypothetical protein